MALRAGAALALATAFLPVPNRDKLTLDYEVQGIAELVLSEVVEAHSSVETDSPLPHGSRTGDAAAG